MKDSRPPEWKSVKPSTLNRTQTLVLKASKRQKKSQRLRVLLKKRRKKRRRRKKKRKRNDEMNGFEHS